MSLKQYTISIPIIAGGNASPKESNFLGTLPLANTINGANLVAKVAINTTVKIAKELNTAECAKNTTKESKDSNKRVKTESILTKLSINPPIKKKICKTQVAF